MGQGVVLHNEWISNNKTVWVGPGLHLWPSK